MTTSGFCRVCGCRLLTPTDKYCYLCGSPQKKPPSAGVKFILALLKCAGYFAVYYGITVLFQLVYEVKVLLDMGVTPWNPTSLDTDSLFAGMSEHFCDVGILSAVAVLFTYFLIFLIRKKHISDEIRLNYVRPLPFSGMLVFGLCSQLAVSLLISFIYTLFPGAAEYSADRTFELLFKNANPLTEFLYIAVITPLLEETVFRGLIYTRLRRAMPRAAAVILSAVIFGAAHGNAEQFLYAGALGILMAALFEKYDSLWASFAVHFAFNAGSFLIAYIPEDGITGLLLFLISTGIFILMLAITFFIKPYNKSGDRYEAL